MTVKLWNNLVWSFMLVQFVACIALLSFSNSVAVQGAALTWMVMGCPCMIGFLIND